MHKIPYSIHAVPLKRAGMASHSQQWLGKLHKRPAYRVKLLRRCLFTLLLSLVAYHQLNGGAF